MSVCLVDSIFDKRLVFRFVCPGRLRHTKIMVGKVIHHTLAKCRLVTVCLLTADFSYQGHKYF